MDELEGQLRASQWLFAQADVSNVANIDSDILQSWSARGLVVQTSHHYTHFQGNVCSKTSVKVAHPALLLATVDMIADELD